jgi:polysaccharide biosynthesis/export protein
VKIFASRLVRVLVGSGFSLLALVLLASCGSMVRNPVPLTDPRVQANVYPQKAYLIDAGDELEIRFFYNPELNDRVIVRPDGFISLQIVGELSVAGMTPGQLTSTLRQQYDSMIQRPEITVTVRTFAAQRVYVDGEVNRPGVVPLTGRVTVLQAIAVAGGYKETARTREAVLIRRGPSNEPLAVPINLENIVNGKDMSQDILLLPYDIVFVPKSSITNVDSFVRQYIRNILPLDLGFVYNYNKP